MTPSNRHPARHHAQVEARRRTALEPFERRPFTTAEALHIGLTHTDLRSHAVTPILRGVYVSGQPQITHGLRCAAAVRLVGGNAWVAGLDAARLMGFPVPEHDRPTVSLPGPLRGRTLNDVMILTRMESAQPWLLHLPEVDGDVTLTHPKEIITECLPLLDLVDGVVLVDAMLKRATRPSRLHQGLLKQASNARVRRVIELARPGAESAMESKLRVLLVLAGLPEPVVQFDVVVEGKTFRFDLAYPQWHIAIEYDGAYHFESEAQKHADERRSECLSRAGWVIVKVVSRGVFRDPVATVDHVAWLLIERGVRVCRSSEWMTHFVQRDPVRGYRADS